MEKKLVVEYRTKKSRRTLLVVFGVFLCLFFVFFSYAMNNNMVNIATAVLGIFMLISVAIIYYIIQKYVINKSSESDDDVVKTINNALDSVDMCVSVSDFDTGDIMFINKKMMKEFGLKEIQVDNMEPQSLQEFILKKQYNPMADSKGKSYENTDFFKCTTDLIESFKGRKININCYTNVAEIKLSEDRLQKQFSQQKLMSEISHSIIMNDSIDVITNNIIKTTGEYFGKSMVFVYQYDEQNSQLIRTNYWSGEDSDCIIVPEKLPFLVDEELYDEFTKNVGITISINEINTGSKYKMFANLGVKSFLAVPIYVLGDFQGVLLILDYVNFNSWSEGEILLAELISSVLSGVFSRYNIEKRLSDSNNVLNYIMENIPIGIFWKDREHNFQGCNDYFAKEFGCTKEEIIGKNDIDLFGKRIGYSKMETDNKIINGDIENFSQDFEITINNKLIWVHSYKALLQDNKFQFIMGLAENITDKKHKDYKLKAISDFFVITKNPIVEMDSEFKFKTFYHEGFEFAGYGMDELLGMSIYEYILEDDCEFIKSIINTSLEKRTHIKEREYRVLNKSGCIRFYVSDIVAVFDENDDIKAFRMTYTDITEKKSIQEELQLMSSIVNSSPEMIAYIKYDGTFEFINDATINITGYSREELLEGTVKMLCEPEMAKHLDKEVLPKVLEFGSQNVEIDVITKSGEIRKLSFSVYLIDANSNRLVLITTDITENKFLEKNLMESIEIAKNASNAKGEFLSRMSHEMRTPMNAIIGMTNIAKKSNDLIKKEYCLDKIDEASKHLLALINDILDMSKIEANKFELSVTEFEFEKMLIRVSNVVNFIAEQKSQEFIVNVDKDVPSKIIADETRISQVITNLLSNAIKFTPEKGTIILNTKVEYESDEYSTLRIEVVDTGIGISEEQISRLFNSFEQADGSTSRKYGGTGLGLAISKKIVELMGGKIWIESEVGKGSKFIFTANIEKCKNTKPVGLNNEINIMNMKILVVDDSLETREQVKYIVNSFGIKCDVAEDGFEALELINKSEANPYKMMLVDWAMPNLNGIELTKKINQIIKNNPVVVMISVSEWSEIEDEAISVGINQFISKPIFPSVLMDTINKCLGIVLEEKKSISITQSHNFKNNKILLVDDVYINREVVMSILEDTNLSIDCAVNGLEAVSMFKENPDKYSLIFMDIHMPEMNGFEACREIRSINSIESNNIPIIAMTANVFREDIEDCIVAGMNEHIGKPINSEEMFNILEKYLPYREEPTKVETNNFKTIEYDNIEEKTSYEYSDFMPEINIEDALSRLMNNKKLYFTLLSNFSGKVMVDKLISSINEANFEDILQTSHALRGVCANLGFEELIKITAKIEENANSMITSIDLIEKLEISSEITMQSIKTLLKSEGIK
jgi:PAS domain S-box-containing protein